MPGTIPGLLPENPGYDDSDVDEIPEPTMQDLLDLLPEPLVRLIQVCSSSGLALRGVMARDRYTVSDYP